MTSSAQLVLRLVLLLGFLSSCGSAANAPQGDAGDASNDVTGPSPDGGGDVRTDDFERTLLGGDWVVRFPSPDLDSQVRIVDGSDLGMGPGSQGFFLVNWVGSTFDANQFCEATIPSDVTDSWAHQVYVRWRASDRARYGFGYNNDPGQLDFGMWYFKYDGVAGPDTRVFATAAASVVPAPGDTLRVEIRGYELRGFHNGVQVLIATDTDPSRIDDGEPGLAARWATGNQPTNTTAKVWESFSAGSLP